MKSILTEYTEMCAICGKPTECTHHLVFGKGLRDLADADKLTLPMCNACHNMSSPASTRLHDNPIAESLSKMLGQVAWEKEYYRTTETDEAREAFRKRYSKSYL